MERSSFFNSINGDRKYEASDFAEFFNSLVTNGIFPNPSTNLQIMSNNNMSITVKSGKAWINGYVYINDSDSDLILNLDVADGVLNRIDRIVVRFDTIGRSINTLVKKGSFASNPVAPTLQRNADGYELGIADIYISKGIIKVVQTDITDLRMNTNHCGMVNSLIQADTTAIFNQYQDWYTNKKIIYDADFLAWTNTEKQGYNTWTTTKKQDYDTWTIAKKQAYDIWYANTVTSEQAQIDNLESQFQSDWDVWFNNIKGVLSGDVAGNLSVKIDAIPRFYNGITNPVNTRAMDFWFKEI